uniref:Uncharacterized protein n=1 Tax=Oryza meridionalis TaxID=40149 RepID=A0A0E0CUD2_9ORYZ
MKSLAVASGNRASSPPFVLYPSRSPPLQYSRISCDCDGGWVPGLEGLGVTTWMVSMRRRMLGWERVERIAFSSRIPPRTRSSILLGSISFTATTSPVRRCVARYTFANEPTPISSRSLYSPTTRGGSTILFSAAAPADLAGAAAIVVVVGKACSGSRETVWIRGPPGGGLGIFVAVNSSPSLSTNDPTRYIWVGPAKGALVGGVRIE